MSILMKDQQHCEPAAGSAPWFTIPHVPIVGVEHPCLITNVAKAVDTLGGPYGMGKLVGDISTTVEADLHLHPGDRNSKPIASFNSKTNNILLKITVPKRTGRKRRKDSNGNWQTIPEMPLSEPCLLSDPNDAERLVRSLRDNPDQYKLEVVGSIKQTHRFRRLSDFVWSTEQSPFMAKMREHILPFEYTKLKNFKLDMSKGRQAGNDIVPPPRWTNITIPFNYAYRQNPASRQVVSATGTTLRNAQRPKRNRIPMVGYDIHAVPAKPPDGIPSESSLPDGFRTLLTAVREILAQRPVCTRRYLQNQVPSEIWKAVGPNVAKTMWQYVGYIWNSGPWRDSICAFGVDPRKDKEMRWYQTLVFQLESEPSDSRMDKAKPSKTKVDRELTAKGENRTGHLFDGRTVGLDGKVWQLADITDPLLRSMLEKSRLRDECHQISDGWYANGTMAKVRVVMKAKLGMILAGNLDDVIRNDELVELCRRIPDVLTVENRSEAILNNGSKRMIALAERVRSAATKPDGGRFGAWNPTVKVQKPRQHLGKGVKGVVTFKLPGEGNKGRKKQSKTKSAEAEGASIGVLDPRLSHAKGGPEEAERQATMRAFEDVSDGSNEVSDDDSDDGSSSESEEEDGGTDDEEEQGDESEEVTDIQQ